MESSSSENFDWKEGRQALMWRECWESFALPYSQLISLLPSWDSSVTWMFSVFSSQEQIELFVVNNIHRSFDPENAYAREQLDTWRGGGGVGSYISQAHPEVLQVYSLLKGDY